MLISVVALQGQSTRIEKNYSGSFSADQIRLLEISNKYGEVVINTWKYDSIKIDVRVEAYGKSQDLVNREIDRVDIDTRQVGSLISSVTDINQGKSRGFFGELLSELEDVSKSLVGNSKLEIDYQVWMPEQLDLSVENKFGDVYLGQLSGDIKIDLSHGDLRADQLSGIVMLKHSFGKHTIDRLADADLTLRGVTSNIRSAQSVSFESSSSEIFLGVMGQVRLDNRNDKIHIEEAIEVSGKGTFTDLNIRKLVTEGRLNFDYGEIFIDQIVQNFGSLRIDGKLCDINLIINQGSYIKSYIQGVEDRMILPNSMLTMLKGVVADSEMISLTGMVGNTQVVLSDLFIVADNGDLIISIEETDVFTNKN
ncbi:MAG: hypothetical protein ACJASN_003228 [Cyclobacteriaceae bacterium]